MAQEQKLTPPYVRFENLPVEDRTASIEAGHPVYKDVAFAFVTVKGERDTLKIEAETWLANLKRRADGELVPVSWVEHFQKLYDYWKKSEAVPESGTPLKNWPGVSPAQLKTLLELHVLTVEDLATLTDEGLKRVGMGGVVLRDKARAFLQSSDTNKASEQIAALKAELEALRAEHAEVLAESKKLADAAKELPAKAPF